MYLTIASETAWIFSKLWNKWYQVIPILGSTAFHGLRISGHKRTIFIFMFFYLFVTVLIYVLKCIYTREALT